MKKLFFLLLLLTICTELAACRGGYTPRPRLGVYIPLI